MRRILALALLKASVSLCAVLYGPSTGTCTLARPTGTHTQPQTHGIPPGLGGAPIRGSIRGLVRPKALATVPTCLEVGYLLDRAVRRLNSFNFRAFFHKYDHVIYNRVIRLLTRVPPLTASYLVLSGVPALLSYLFNNNAPFGWMTFDLDKVLRGQVWRLFTPYFLFGQLWLNHYMLSSSALTYMSNVELGHINKPEKFIEFLAFGVLSLSSYSFLEAYLRRRYALGGGCAFDNLAFHLHVFVLYFWSRMNEGQRVECMDFFTIPAELVPYLFILQNFLFYQSGALTDVVALALSYLYFNLLSSRKTCFLFRAFKTDSLRKLYLKFRDEIPY